MYRNYQTDARTY